MKIDSPGWFRDLGVHLRVRGDYGESAQTMASSCYNFLGISVLRRILRHSTRCTCISGARSEIECGNRMPKRNMKPSGYDVVRKRFYPARYLQRIFRSLSKKQEEHRRWSVGRSEFRSASILSPLAGLRLILGRHLLKDRSFVRTPWNSSEETGASSKAIGCLLEASLECAEINFLDERKARNGI